ncbi:hypothetical protein PgNI_10231 [Pyricularia grisea]|uniref:Uncharacterized protein n=1 Tax=Pyricularia grisea TaxID=148305 RepID=A0A6P8AX46_PYRGI|nr:hypothetical protein PgNI_10231 [Pyricularia grisea]TLD06879.1 hypothetical protein PgNI_10231 [Pyricularia grisea]
MTKVLGYHEYITQGMGYMYPEQCNATHYNVARPKPPSETLLPGADINATTYLKGVKIGLDLFPKMSRSFPLWNKTLDDVVLNKMHASGDHFATFEGPEEIVMTCKKCFTEVKALMEWQ